ncbi:hypothetical protein [Streptomyces tsukubensis]|uniref:Uncharacterized protein n=1 Tax=Streptomyces tsukubensis TaxID=83656 RepID=A0A1V4A202_9ACTN|nr:hypothetical protein [Streptomyces tsukubensis]OON73002.1 hypothetical protein B1H18_27985 [Streptomyces tsukubensis]QFR93985.1 transcriptional regulator [Streptomyces tsukubensis]
MTAAVSPMLRRLARERATGALMRDRGTLYLAGGQVVHAEAPAAPTIDVLLTTGGALRPESWWEAVTEAGTGHRVGAYLVDSGQVTCGALELCHLGALYDAAFFALAPSSGPARFRYGVVHWLGPVRPVAADAVERETVRRRELLDTIWPDAETDHAPLVRLPEDAPVTARQRHLLEYVDGVRTAPDIARALGRPAFHTLVDLRRLAAAGVVSTLREDPSAPAAPSWLPEVSADPDIALLRRLRDALEATL